MPASAERTQIRAIVNDLDRLTERVVRKIALDVTANLIEQTPVDTGWARANWVPAIGAPVVRDLTGAGRNLAAASAEQAAGQAGVLRYKLNRGKVFVSNNAPYITRLNDGHSRKAPAGFVQRAIRKAVTEDIRGLRD